MSTVRSKRWGPLAAATAAVLVAAGLAAVGAMPAVAAPAAPTAPAAQPPSIVPKPVSTTLGSGAFSLEAGATIRVSGAGAKAIGTDLATSLRPATGFALPVAGGSARGGDIQLTIGDPGTLGGDTQHEGYQLSVTTDHVTVVAPTTAGLFHGVQTIRQLLPAWSASSTAQPGPWTMPAVSITDYPRYDYRGVMVDIARHYQTPEAVEKIIDEASTYKMDTLHLHLSDDQGFRVVINGFPRLTAVGGQGSVGTGGNTMDPGGFWTQKQYKDVVAYAKAHFMSVVPEVDSPSHNNAIEMSEYNDVKNPRLNGHPQDIACGYDDPPTWNYTTDVGFSGMCPDSDNTWTIYTAITNQLAKLSSSPYYDLGGDEAHPFTAAQYADFVNKETPIVQATGKIPMGWADGYATTAGTTPPAGSIAESWMRGAADGAAAVAKGMKVVMAPSDHAYLDETYPNDDSGLGLSWACKGCDLDVTYDWDPGSFTGVPDSSVLGVEGAIFGETTPTLEDIQYLLFPRLMAIAELGWSPKADRSGVTSAAFTDFAQRVSTQGPRMQAAGVNFFPTTQVPWSITGTGVGAAPSGQVKVAGTIAKLSAPGFAPGDLSATIDWGDNTKRTAATITGTAPTPGRTGGLYDIAGQHKYRTDGIHTVTVTVTATNGPTGTIIIGPDNGQGTGGNTNGRIRVLTMNIQHGADANDHFNIDQTAKLIADSGANVVNLQEVDKNYSARSNNLDEPNYLAKALNMQVVYGAWLHSPGEFGDAILTKGQVTESHTHLLPTTPGDEQRGIVEATITLNGRTFHDYNTHLAYPSVPEAEQQARAVQQYVATTSGPFVLSGDFNLLPNDVAIQSLSGQLTDSWTAVGQGPGYTHSSLDPTERIDYVFAAPGVKVRSAAVVTNTTASDHLPVSADLTIPSSPTAVGPDVPWQTQLSLDGGVSTAVGGSVNVTGTFTNAGPDPVSAVQATLTGPAGWTIQPADAQTFPTVAPHSSVSLQWQVKAPADASPGSALLSATATYDTGGVDGLIAAQTAVAVTAPRVADGARWDFTTGSAADHSGNGHDGTAGTAVAYTDAGAHLNGTAQGQITVPYSFGYQPEAAPTGKTWHLNLTGVVPDSINGQYQTIAEDRDAGANGWILYITPTGAIQFWAGRADGKYATASSGVTAVAGQSYDIQIGSDGTQLSIAVTGAAQGSGSAALGGTYQPVNNGPLRFGAGGTNGTTAFFTGQIATAEITFN